MKHSLLVLLTVGLATTPMIDVPAKAHVYSVEAVQAGRVAHPSQWVGRTTLIHGVMLRAPDTELLLVDTRVLATLPRGATIAQAAEMVLIMSRINSPEPFLVLRTRDRARYGRDEKPRTYQVHLRSSACPLQGACDDGTLLSASFLSVTANPLAPTRRSSV